MQGLAGFRAGACITAVCLALFVLSCEERPAPASGPPATGAPRPAAPGLQVGDVAPDFSLPGSDGRNYTLASYRGRQAVVLAWFSKAFTAG